MFFASAYCFSATSSEVNSEIVGVLAQIALYESLLASEHRTTKGDEADFFYVPLLHACVVEQADAAPHLSTQVLASINSIVAAKTCTLYARMSFKNGCYVSLLHDAMPCLRVLF